MRTFELQLSANKEFFCHDWSSFLCRYRVLPFLKNKNATSCTLRVSDKKPKEIGFTKASIIGGTVSYRHPTKHRLIQVALLSNVVKAIGVPLSYSSVTKLYFKFST
jgi:hypothetical protein